MLHAGGPAIVQNAAMKRHRPTAPVLCPCGLNTPYAECCGLWHAGKIAPDAEKLMRSRYVAYVMNLKDYIYSTWHPSTRPVTDFDVNGDGKLSAAKFIGLTVLTHIRTTADTATVEFVARYKSGGRAFRMHETSRFVFEHSRWWYIDGEVSDH